MRLNGWKHEPITITITDEESYCLRRMISDFVARINESNRDEFKDAIFAIADLNEKVLAAIEQKQNGTDTWN